MDDRKRRIVSEAEPGRQRPKDKPKPADTEQPVAPSDMGAGGMIGEGTSGEASAEVTEADPRTSRPGGMIGEG